MNELGFFDPLQPAERLDDLRGKRLIDVDPHQGRLSGDRGSPHHHVGDVDVQLTQEGAHPSNEARNIGVANDEQVLGEG